RKFAVSDFRDQRLLMLEIGQHQGDAVSPFVRIHVRRALSPSDLTEPACMLDRDGADAEPHRPRAVTNEEQRGRWGGDEIKLDRLRRDYLAFRPIAFD